MVWQKIDDQFGVSKKVMRIPRAKRQRCVGLWLLALNASGRYSTNGILEAGDLDELEARATEADELVRVGLWHRPGHDCARCDQPAKGGAVVHDFLHYNPDSASINASKELKSEGGKHGNHIRWHVGRRIVVAGCEWCDSLTDRLCDSLGNRTVIASESGANPPSPSPVPFPKKKTDSGNPVPVRLVSTARPEATDEEFIHGEATRLGIKNLPRVVRAFERVLGDVSEAQAIDYARAVIDLSTEHVKSIEAYIETACTNSPEQIREIAA